MMKPIFLAGSLVLAAVFTVRLSGATVDGGFTSELIGTAQGGRLAIIAEASIQESCQYQECTIYVIDTTQTEFKRTQMVRLPSRNDELKKSLCRGLGRDECVKKVSSQLIAEEQHERSNYQILVERYLSSLTIWDRTRLGKVAPGPEPEKLKATEEFSGKSSPLVLDEIGIQIHLRERWTAPSFRSTAGGETFCNPDKLAACSTEERWEDGRRLQAWVCAPPGAAEPDCSGRASFVRAEAGFEESKLSEGRSVWVEPGRLAQAYMELVTDRTVNLETLQMARHSIKVHRLPGAYVVTGGFAHGMYANGSWFPLVVAVPLSLKTPL